MVLQHGAATRCCNTVLQHGAATWCITVQQRVRSKAQQNAALQCMCEGGKIRHASRCNTVLQKPGAAWEDYKISV
jgi:hypothetical protein